MIECATCSQWSMFRVLDIYNFDSSCKIHGWKVWRLGLKHSGLKCHATILIQIFLAVCQNSLKLWAQVSTFWFLEFLDRNFAKRLLNYFVHGCPVKKLKIIMLFLSEEGKWRWKQIVDKEKLKHLPYGSTGCGVFKQGVQN